MKHISEKIAVVAIVLLVVGIILTQFNALLGDRITEGYFVTAVIMVIITIFKRIIN